jgi:serine/threonine protein kinase
MNKSATIDKYVYSTKPIGKGAFSLVYKGFNVDTDEIVAIKIINKYTLKDTMKDRLYSEIKMLQELSHPYIVEYKEFIVDEQHYYIILEYCGGGDLSGLIRKGRVPEHSTQDYIKQLACVLKYLKTKNIIHRDLKPQNILLSSDYKIIKLTDFNFAKSIVINDITQTFCGSPLYMSPEILLGNEYSIKSDLWSIGLIIYELLHGINPFHTCQSIPDLIKQLNVFKLSININLSDQCIDLLKKLLVKNPEERISWDDFFAHPWLNEDNELWSSSLDSSNITLPKSQPIKIGNNDLKLVDNYIPLGATPPKYTQSAPMDFRRRSASSPDSKKVSDNIWSYMNTSAAVLKGAVDYISFK